MSDVHVSIESSPAGSLSSDETEESQVQTVAERLDELSQIEALIISSLGEAATALDAMNPSASPASDCKDVFMKHSEEFLDILEVRLHNAQFNNFRKLAHD